MVLEPLQQGAEVDHRLIRSNSAAIKPSAFPSAISPSAQRSAGLEDGHGAHLDDGQRLGLQVVCQEVPAPPALVRRLAVGELQPVASTGSARDAEAVNREVGVFAGHVES